MEVRKEVIRSGKHVYIGSDGRPAVLHTTPEKIDHYYRSGTEMLNSGIPIPVPLEHQPSATPMNAMDRAANLVRNNAGETKRFERDTIKDPKTGEDIHRVLSVLDIKDEQVAQKIKDGSVRWVSPWISSFVDGQGKKWDEVISHVALTTRPRIHSQKPFENIGMALSMTATPASFPADGVLLTPAGLLKSDGKPKFPIAFSLLTGVKLSKDDLKDMDDDEDDAEDEDTMAGEGEGDKGTPVDQFAGDEAMAGMETEAGDVTFEELIPHLLELHGIHVPAGGKGKEFLQALVQGLLTSAKTMAANDGGEDDSVLGDTGKEPTSPVVQESPPMYMSLTADEVKRIADPKERQIAEAFLSLRVESDRNKAAAEAARKNILDDAAKSRQARIERLARRIPAASRDKLIQSLSSPSAALSLGSDGVVRDPAAGMLELVESIIPDMPAMLRGDAKFSEAEQPAMDGVITDARAEAIAKGMLGRRGENAA